MNTFAVSDKYSATAIVRWMTLEGYEFSDVEFTLDTLGLTLNDHTIRVQMNIARHGKNGKQYFVPPLTKREQREIAKINA